MLYGRFIQSRQVDKVAPFHDPLKTLKLKTLASDCVIIKDVTTMPLLIYYDQLVIYIYLYTSYYKRSYLRNLVNL